LPPCWRMNSSLCTNIPLDPQHGSYTRPLNGSIISTSRPTTQRGLELANLLTLSARKLARGRHDAGLGEPLRGSIGPVLAPLAPEAGTVGRWPAMRDHAGTMEAARQALWAIDAALYSVPTPSQYAPTASGYRQLVEDFNRWIVTKGMPSVRAVVDDGYSGAELVRPALDRLRTAVRAHQVDLVLVHDPDRLSRKLAHQLLLADEIERAGVRLEFVTTPREETPEGRLLLHVKGVISEYEREKIRERSMRGKSEKARRGLFLGPPPFGYLLVPPGLLLIDERTAPVVRLIYTLCVEQQRSLRAIVSELRRVGIPPPKGPAWTVTTVRRILTDPVYEGQAYFGRRRRIVEPAAVTGRAHTRVRYVPRPSEEWIPIPAPVLIAPELAARARQQIQKNHDALVGRPAREPRLLRGLLVCGRCRGRYHTTTAHGLHYYRCRRKADRLETVRCPARVLRADQLDALVWETVVGVLRRPEISWRSSKRTG
jgi:DNA invertase Pin-like site-specific DNA recombinase